MPRERDGSLYEGVLTVVRALGGSHGLQDALTLIADASVQVLDFGAAAINVLTPEGDLRVDAVAGPAGVRELLGTRRPVGAWTAMLGAAEVWGDLRFFSHVQDQSPLDGFVTWSPDTVAAGGPDAWHPDDSLFAPLWDGERQLVGVLSVDAPTTGRHPDPEQRRVLELFAAQAARVIRDAMNDEQASAARAEVESRWQLAFQQSPIGIALIDTTGAIVEANSALAELLGHPTARLTAMALADITHPDDVANDAALLAEVIEGSRDNYELEKRYLRPDARVVHTILHVGAVRNADHSVQTVVAQISDITERKTAERLLTHQLSFDQLTGLPNRSNLSDHLARLLATGEPTAVLYCDLDRFKSVNNSLGRSVGDDLLVAVARRLSDALPSGCVLGRVCDDEFAILVPRQDDAAAVRHLGEHLLGALRRPLVAGNIRHTLTASIGAAVSLSRHRHADELMADAEEALRRAKRGGRARVELYDPEQDHHSTLAELQLEQQLRVAIDSRSGLAVYLQPIVDLETEIAVGAEALIRWRHPELGLLQPGQFLPTAERSGLIVDLGWWTLSLGALAAEQTRRDTGASPWVAINVSGSQLGRGQLPAAVREALRINDLPPAALHLEITETALVDASRQGLKEVHEIADLGVSIALDDFGTGFSSLSLLRDLPISIVKIDQSFTQPAAEDRRTAALVRSVVNMCNALDIRTIAEGIETREQLTLVRGLGCDYAQGYLFGRAEPGQPG